MQNAKSKKTKLNVSKIKRSRSQVRFLVSPEISFFENFDASLTLFRSDERETIYRIDGLAAKIFVNLKQGKSLDKIVETMAKKTNLSQKEISRKTDKLMKDLVRHSLVTPETSR